MNTHLQLQVNHWLENDPDPRTQTQLQTLIDNGSEAELAARFAGRLEFGTAGLRGVVGAGPMGMNRLVIRQTSAGLGAYLLDQIKDAAERGVVIGYDGRHDSFNFAHDAASVLTAMGIKVRLTSKVAPTPLVAFGVKHFNAAAGIVVTASHNPPQYNGYKVYWENGAQIIPPHDSGIAAQIERAANQVIPFLEHDEAVKQGKLIILQDDFYQSYRHGVQQAEVLQNHTAPEKVSLAYTAMHGVGAEMAETVLKDAGFTQVYSVASQREPDGDFPTVNFPNPEEKGAMDLVIVEAKKHGAMLACANDPDADRFAVAVRRDDGEYQMLTGDQVGVLFGHYLLSHAKDNQRLTGTTIVSSSLLSKIAQGFGTQSFTTLTGFKWLMNVGIAKTSPEDQFLFAYEEALGYTVGSMVWDKDGLSALVAFAQLTAELVAKGQTIWDRLEQIYREHGFHLNAQVSIALKPDTPNIGAYLREHPPVKIGEHDVLSTDDLKALERRFADGSVEKIDLPPSDVLTYCLAGGARVIVRPSGTEPKIKCYYEVVETMVDTDTLASTQARASKAMDDFIQAHQASLPK
ncbi:phospho-sugar mutase [Shewanella baltica]|uniref:phospho-sugar mutase n=1 Tax=Shewanella baltica TaxID=62322 RepID=UPI00217EABB6|nr:phospho-sugar mutase [Shewanella baltica]MCS6160517.1 phospho-sugar mutase [Shewanella baltica]MCS6237346.1 phospho-sugar mutase [Shewanella baltica]MCS6261255.1 phospho-sugar mutase [Shewanella baltica]MCS6271950.1 phospho-sugar mutase [Shewanella baltica]